jgi:hypothetical protein
MVRTAFLAKLFRVCQRRNDFVVIVVPMFGQVNAAGSSFLESTLKAGLNQHKPAKRTRNRIPPPQRMRVLQKYAAGKSIVEIGREEGRNRESITKIGRSDEMREHVHRMREVFYGLADSALVAMRHALEVEKDGQLAYKILADIGAVPTAVERQQIQDAAASKSEENAVLTIATKIFAGGIAKLRLYGHDTTKEENDLAEAGGRVNAEGRIVPIE